jgi:ubiquitin-protein ligase E3 C
LYYLAVFNVVSNVRHKNPASQSRKFSLHATTTMLPLFTDERRKPINLGGPSSASTHAAIIDQAKARRSERQDLRKRIDAAVRIQAYWRGVQTRRQLRCRGEGVGAGDVGSLDVLRWVVLVGGKDEDVLGRWSMGVVGSGDGGPRKLFKCAEGVGASSWVVLIRQMSVLLLECVANDRLMIPCASCIVFPG